MLRAAVVGSLATVPVAAAAGALWRGWRGLASASLGAATTIGFFVLGSLAIGAVTRGPAATLLPGAFVVYVTQVGLLLLVLVALRHAGFMVPGAYAAGALLALLGWQVCHTTAYARGRHAIYPGLDDESSVR